MNGFHAPVLPAETVAYLAPKPGETALDATLGGGGHGALLARDLTPGGVLVGLDRDPEALRVAEDRLAPWKHTLSIIQIHAAFGKLDAALDESAQTAGLRFDLALFDLGVSSHQLDTPRGFSFRRDEPLDMRMDPAHPETAAGLLQRLSMQEITHILQDYGEERWASRIARALDARRKRAAPVRTTGELAALVEAAVPRAAWPRDIHVATRVFQALRIAVNEELDQLNMGLEAAVARLAPGGRIAVISYHSLEHRIVKQMFARLSGRAPSPPAWDPAVFCPLAPPILTALTRKPITPSPEEIARNPRSRSAQMRVAQRNS